MGNRNFTRRALYSRAGKGLQKELRKQWRKTELGKAVEQSRRSYRATVSSVRKLEDILRGLARGGSQSLKGAMSHDFSALIASLVGMKATPGQSDNARRVAKQLDRLGPAGEVVKAIVNASATRSQSPDRDIEAAKAVIEAIGSPSSGGKTKGSQSGAMQESIEAAKALLEASGYRVEGAGGPAPGGGASGGGGKRGGGRRGGAGSSGGDSGGDGGGSSSSGGEGSGGGDGKVEIDLGGRKARFPRNHPIVTKEKTFTPESSNVYWFLYDVDKWTLYIRFQYPSQTDAPTHKPGAFYAYSHVPPDVFLRFLKANSKGTFVWDEIRIRGTVSGHRYDYRLVGSNGNYVPRKATLMPDGEWFIKRTVPVTRRSGTREILSSKESAPVAPFRAPPNRGQSPNRGRPNDGRPRR